MKRLIPGLILAVFALALPAAAQAYNDDDGLLPKAPPRQYEATINGYFIMPVPGLPGIAVGMVTLSSQTPLGWTPYFVGPLFVQHNAPIGFVGTVPLSIPVPGGEVVGWMTQMPGEPDWKFLLRIASVTQFVKDLHGV